MRTVFANFLIALAVTAGAVAISGKTPAELSVYPDAESSIALSEGSAAGVRLHHARRIFHPLAAAAVRALTGASTIDAFVMLGVFTLFGFVFLLLAALAPEGGRGFDRFAAACVFLPFPIVLYELSFLQLPMFMFLLAAYLHAARRENWAVLAMLLFCLILTREDGMLVGIFSVLALWRRAIRAPAVLLIGATAAAQGVVWWVSRGAENLHASSYLLFSAARLPVFYLRNFFGIEHWVDTYRALPMYTHAPIALWPVPSMFWSLSSVREFGIYVWNPVNIFQTLALIFGTFGILPLMLLSLWRKRSTLSLQSAGHWSYLALGLFGLAAFLLAPGSGPPNIRYYLGAWPLFFWVLRYFGDEAAPKLLRSRPVLLAAHFAASWMLFMIFR